MIYVNYTNNDELLRSEIYPLLEKKTRVITLGGFDDEKALSTAALPSAMIKHMAEQGNLIREPNERSSVQAMKIDPKLAIQVIGAILQWIQANPGFIDWIRNGMDFWRLNAYRLLVYRVKDKGVFLEFQIK